MSSHREAPEISKDPVADSTDLYAFVSPDQPDTLTLIANYIPLEGPAGGPNFYSFGDDVLYEIHIDTTGDARPDLTYQFRFHTELRNPDTFLYNTGPILSLDSPNWNNRQFYTLTRVTPHKRRSSRPDWPARRATSGRCPPRTTPRSPRPPCRTSPAGSRSSPGSAPMGSTWTSARFSTSRTCGRLRTCTRSTG